MQVAEYVSSTIKVKYCTALFLQEFQFFAIASERASCGLRVNRTAIKKKFVAARIGFVYSSARA